MRLKIYVLSLLISSFSLTGYSQATIGKSIAPPKMLFYLDASIKKRIVVLYHEDRAAKLFGLDKTYLPTGLSAKEIEIVQNLITERAMLYNRTHPQKYERIVKPEKYFKQLVAAINAKGEKKVIAFCYCVVLKGIWTKRVGITSDGGRCYFVVKIDLTTRIVEQFSVAGPA